MVKQILTRTKDELKTMQQSRVQKCNKRILRCKKNDDEYFDALHKKIEDLYEIYPDSLARYLSLAFYKWAADVSKGKCKV